MRAQGGESIGWMSYPGNVTSTIANALDPMVMLATGIHSQPGVYAVLLGSGISTGAGIPTGWGVVQELVRRAAAAENPAEEAAAEQAAAEPENWWAEHGDGKPLGYSHLLAALAPTPASRRGLLAGFFEPTEDDAKQGLKVPSVAHRALAQVVKRGLVRVILTTNFDRLTERALEEAGAPPQVLSRPDAISGITPLAHAAATVIKVNGDYADLEMRNTLDELSEYPPDWNRLLAQVLDEYGLLISGWSADWDTALVAAIDRSPARRYPLYWDQRSCKTEPARQLLTNRSGIVVPAVSADDLFTGLHERVEALERLTEPPLTTAIAVTRLKRYLPDPTRRIDLHDLVTDEVAEATEKATASPTYLASFDGHVFEALFDKLLADVTPALHLLVAGAYHDRSREHIPLWVASLERLMKARAAIEGVAFHEVLDRARHYPALLALRAMGIASVYAGNEDLLIRLLTEPKWRDRYNNRARTPAAHALHDLRVLEPEVIKTLPRWGKSRWLYPQSHLLRADLREVLRAVLPEEDDYKLANDQYEYRVALVQHQIRNTPGLYNSATGEFIGEGQWDSSGVPLIEIDFRAVADQAADDWPWWQIVGGQDEIDTTLTRLREDLEVLRRG